MQLSVQNNSSTASRQQKTSKTTTIYSPYIYITTERQQTEKKTNRAISFFIHEQALVNTPTHICSELAKNF
jgi:hypothetical protein